ncbi:trypco2 family protein [Kitasatospora sp. NPDC056531]|uniref:trypco2 family protein n=1 Tax=Kitasatospora sp. NPDC056531 TaxID=3345856 RepID=UPI0036A01970
MSQEPWAELGETISAIRSELRQAMAAGEDEELKFRTGPVELEFSVEVKKEGSARTKILVLPWSAEVRGGGSTERVHRIKLTLQPVLDGTGEEVTIADRWSPQTD